MIRPALVAIAALVAAPLAAQDAEEGSAGPKDRRDATHFVRVGDIPVVTAEGEVIGDINEILIDSEGQPAGFLIEMGGFLDLGDTDVAVPLGSLQWNGAEYVSKMTEEQLKNLRPWDE